MHFLTHTCNSGQVSFYCNNICTSTPVLIDLTKAPIVLACVLMKWAQCEKDLCLLMIKGITDEEVIIITVRYVTTLN